MLNKNLIPKNWFFNRISGRADNSWPEPKERRREDEKVVFVFWTIFIKVETEESETGLASSWEETSPHDFAVFALVMSCRYAAKGWKDLEKNS